MELFAHDSCKGDVTPPELAPAHIHLVDDDGSIGTAIVRLLASAGFRATAYRSAESFLARSDPEEHGCLILDIAMPGLDGLGLQQAIAERCCHIVIITGDDCAEYRDRAFRQGARAYLRKPVDDVMLVDAIQNALLPVPRGNASSSPSM